MDALNPAKRRAAQRPTPQRVRDFRPAGTLGCDCRGDCYTVVIRGEEKHLFFERVDPLFSGRVGRWFVEKTV